MIEKWLQFTCDRCGETDNSTTPDMTVAEFRREARIKRIRNQDLCVECQKAVKLIRVPS